ncbi:hypothetical protein [Rubrivirga sp. IMCC45206]|uniref:hypothetical protein n=1 Tax=Rubrivirga sp. IMCC45206 TaxID=3391614 RepID=UPI00398FF79F
MTTRTIHGPDDTEWTLAEALVGSDAERDDDDTVPVVATPSGGEQSVRLALAPGWAEADDADLVAALDAARDGPEAR